MTDGTDRFPENFEFLHAAEGRIRQQSIAAIEASADLTLHIHVIEAAINSMQHYILRDGHQDEDDLHVRLLGIRLSNGAMASLTMLLTGFYQSAALLERDIMETSFLLDYLSLDRSRVAHWRTADEKTLRDDYKPVTVRIALDDHYQHVGKKRAADYKLFSELASHPTPKGFAMLRRPGGDHEWGPFFDATALTATISELAKLAILSGETLERFFMRATRLDYETQFRFYSTKVRWFERFLDRPLDTSELANIRAALNRLPD